MSKAYKCDLTGKLFEGTAPRAINVPLKENLRLQCTLQRKVGQAWVPANVSEEAAAILVDEIGAAVLAKYGDTADAPKVKKGADKP